MQGGDSGEFLSGQPAAEPEITDGLMLLARNLVIDTSVTHTAHDWQVINTKSEYFQELCHAYGCEPVLSTTRTTDLMFWK